MEIHVQGKLNRQINRASEKYRSTSIYFEQIEIAILYLYQTYNNTFCGFFGGLNSYFEKGDEGGATLIFLLPTPSCDILLGRSTNQKNNGA